MSTNDQLTVKKIVKKSGSSFYWGMNILDGEKRRAMFTLYCFCRVVDDIADSNKSKIEKSSELMQWKKKIKLVYKNKSSDFLTRELLLLVKKFSINHKDFISIIDGMIMDVDEKIIYPSRKKIELYCDRVAGAVGCISIKIFGINEPSGRNYAIYLGRAFQLTNILRDLREDCERDRCYIPYNYISKYKLEKLTPKELLVNINFKNIIDELIIETKSYYKLAKNLSLTLDKKKIKASELMREIYEKTFEKICKSNNLTFKKVKLSKIEKFFIILKKLARG